MRRYEPICNFRLRRSFPDSRQWKGLKSIGIVTSRCLRDGKESVEVRYYISSLAVDVKQFARAVRGHWGIENTLHWSLDMTFREDESRIREQHLRENFAWLNRFALSLLKQHPGRQSLVMKRRSCGWSDTFYGSRYRINMLVCAGPGVVDYVLPLEYEINPRPLAVRP